MWDKIKSYIPGLGFMVKVLIVVVVINAVLELIGGVFASFVSRPVATVKSLAGKSAAIAVNLAVPAALAIGAFAIGA